MEKTIENSKEEMQRAKKGTIYNFQRCKLKLGDAFLHLSN